jgi:methylase of polypeptide subunit release factors
VSRLHGGRAVQSLTEAERALLEIGGWLRDQSYAFIAITPESHRRVHARAQAARTARDVFGWSRPFAPSLLPERIVEALRRADMLASQGGQLVSGARFATLGDQLFVHSAYPTVEDASVFFGPDTYRFARFVAARAGTARMLVDIGAGSGAGALSMARAAQRIVLADINPRAVSFARVNAHLAGVHEKTEVVGGDLYANVVGDPDLIIANPPYLVDAAHRTYRDGGGALGTDLGLRMVVRGLARLAPRGRFLLYTGAPIVDGIDRVREALVEIAAAADADLAYEEIDPDVFGEELDTPAYAHVDRIAAVGATIARRT